MPDLSGCQYQFQFTPMSEDYFPWLQIESHLGQIKYQFLDTKVKLVRFIKD